LVITFQIPFWLLSNATIINDTYTRKNFVASAKTANLPSAGKVIEYHYYYYDHGGHK